MFVSADYDFLNEKTIFPEEQIFSQFLYIYKEKKESDSLWKLVAVKGLDITPDWVPCAGGVAEGAFGG